VILGLTAFVVAVICGMAVDNPMDVTLSRALTSLLAGFFIGLFLGAAMSHVVEAHVKQYKLNNPLPTPNPNQGSDEPVQIVDEV
jgi:hypothetical protein